MRPSTLPRNSSGVIAANTNWKYASVAVGKWNGIAVFAADIAWPCSPRLLVMPPGFPRKLSKKCVKVPVVPAFCVWVTNPSTTLTPPPMEVEPKPSLYSHNTQATSTRENPANIIERTLTAHFLGTIDA